jgi:N-acetylneuraminic acid mutarotase
MQSGALKPNADLIEGHVFISYVRENSREVDELQLALESAGVRVWRDTSDLWPGQDWRARIRRAISDDALVFIACFSSVGLRRKKGFHNEELTLAIEQLRLRQPDDPWLIPVRFDACEIPDRDIGGGRMLASIQRADLFGERSGEETARLVAIVLQILGRDQDQLDFRWSAKGRIDRVALIVTLAATWVALILPALSSVAPWWVIVAVAAAGPVALAWALAAQWRFVQMALGQLEALIQQDIGSRHARRVRSRKVLHTAATLLAALATMATAVAAGFGISAVIGHHVSQWQFTGSLAAGHAGTHFVQLHDGRVLAISGDLGNGVFTSTAEVYNPNTGRWTAAGTLHDARMAFGQPSVLPNGDVLVAGGHDPHVVDYATAELYDPATNQWTQTGSLNTARRYDVQVELKNGEVLVATGSNGPPTCNRFLNSAELYNPATGKWTYTGPTLRSRESDMGIRLADGRVLLAGGYTCGSEGDTDPVVTELYNPATGQWSQAGNLLPHGWEGGTMVLLHDNRVLLVDGRQLITGRAFAEAVIFNPATDQWTEAAPPKLPRVNPAVTVLADGKVLVSQGGQLQSEIYDPETNTWSLGAVARDINNGGQSFLLPTGEVLLAGGSNSSGPSTTAELYTP